jgi:AraC-like DNA-binding protein
MLATVERGGVRLRHEAGLAEIVPGSTVLLNPGDVHDAVGISEAERWHYRVFFLPQTILNLVSERERLAFRHTVSSEASLWRRLIALHRTLEEQGTLLERSTALTGLIESLAPEVSGAALDTGEISPSVALDRVRQYLEAHWMDAVSLADLGVVAGLSRFHLLRSFRRQYGLAPHAFQLQLRVQRAKQMLFEGAAAKDTAVECGFFDQAHLTRTMRRYVGVTPARVAAISSKP